VTFLSYVTGCVHTLCQEKITGFKNDNSSYRKSGIVVVQNVPLRMTGSSMATGYDVIKHHVTPKGVSLGEVCACATGNCGFKSKPKVVRDSSALRRLL
jgi:hypothetical protein